MVELVRQNFQKNQKLYNQIEKELKSKIGEIATITHIGSTAIPNMYGKNIIDILIGAKDSSEFEEITIQLINMGYLASQKNQNDIYRFFSSTEAETGPGDIHIHLSIIETERYREFIVLKNYLLCNETEAKNYSNFKKEIIEKDIKDRKKYKAVKSEYISNLLLKAREH